MCLLLRLTTDGFGVPKHQRVDPLVAVPALVLSLSQELPLATTWHLFLHSNDTAQDKLPFLDIVWELRFLLLNPLLLHYLPEPDGVCGDQFVFAFNRFLIHELLLQTQQHVGVESEINLFVHVNLYFRFSLFFALEHTFDGGLKACLFQAWVLAEMY